MTPQKLKSILRELDSEIVALADDDFLPEQSVDHAEPARTLDFSAVLLLVPRLKRFNALYAVPTFMDDSHDVEVDLKEFTPQEILDLQDCWWLRSHRTFFHVAPLREAGDLYHRISLIAIYVVWSMCYLLCMRTPQKKQHIRQNKLDTAPKKRLRNTTQTSWGKEADWYTKHLDDGDTYHAQVILPNILRILTVVPGMRILEIGCGNGYFARAFQKEGGIVCASDIAPELIAVAKEKGPQDISYHVSPAQDLSWYPPEGADVVVAVLTLQNMDALDVVVKEVARVLAPKGRFVCVLNHPVMRIPQHTAWGFDEGAMAQYRRINTYMTPTKIAIEMHPGKRGSASRTYSYHRPLQDYMKLFRTNGLCVTRLEEWISHRTSEKGPRQKAENTARKEFPLFMMLELMHAPC